MWERSVARAIGASGISFTNTRVAQTLHLPCHAGGGHVVDYPIKGAQPPEKVSRNLVNQGWTIGHRLTCPDHQRKSTKALAEPAPVEQAEPLKRTRGPNKGPRFSYRKGREAILEALEQFPGIKHSTIMDLTMMSSASVSVAVAELLKEGIIIKVGGKAHSRTDPLRYALKNEEAPMETATVVPIQPKPEEVSEAARAARRLATLLLEEKFDVATGQYRDGYTDEKVAKETGAALAFVFKRREDDFGPLKVPGDLQDCRDEIARIRLAAEQQLEAIEIDNRQKIGLIVRDLDNCVNRIETLVRRNGWKS